MRKDIFNELLNKKEVKFKEYENTFKEKTGISYEVFLREQYVELNKTSTDISKLLNIDQFKVRDHINKYNLRKIKPKDNNSIMTKTPTQIERETGRKLTDIYNELSDQGYSLSEIALKLNLSSVTSLSGYLQREKMKNTQLDKNKLILKGELIGKDLSQIKQIFINKLGIEYKDWIENKYIKEGYSPKQIYEMTGIKRSTLDKHIQRFELKKSKTKAHLDAIEHGIYDPQKNLKKARKTMRNSKSKSNIQDKFINLLRYHFEMLTTQYKDIEVITGYNEWSILHNYEIDIPIIIFYNEKIYKIAIEYDGDIWHSNRKTDGTKETLLKEKKWHLIRIDSDSYKYTNMKLLEDIAINTINKIIKLIN